MVKEKLGDSFIRNRKWSLWNTYMGAYSSALSVPWKVYGNHSHRLLCKDYRNDKSGKLDNLTVVKCIKKDDYWRIVVAD